MTAPRPLARALAIGLALCSGAVFAAVFLSRLPSVGVALARLPQPLVAAALVVLASYAAGTVALAMTRAIFRRVGGLRDEGFAAEENVAPGFAAVLLVGFPAFGTAVALIAWTGVAIQLAILVFTVALAAVGVWLVARSRAERGRIDGWDALLFGPPVAIAAIGAISPVNSPDELVYKLAIPKTYLELGGMVDLPLNSYSYASNALSHVSLAALALSGGIAAKLAHAALFVAALVVLRRLGDRLAPGSGRWVAAVLAWTPALMLIAGWAWSEWGVLALLLLSYLGWLDFQERPTTNNAALVVGALAGAAAIKYTALPWLLVFGAIAAIRIGRGGAGGRVAPSDDAALRLGPLLAAASLSMLVLGSFFYLRNWLWSGSPVAPFLLSGAPAIENYRSQGRLSGWQELLLGYDIVHAGIVDDALGVLLPVCAVLAPLGALRYRAARDLFWIGLVPLPFLVAAAPTSRLMLTSAVPLAVVGAIHLAASWRAVATTLVRWVAAAAAGVAMAMQLALVLYVIVSSYEPFGVLAGSETEAAYFQRMRAYTPVYRWIAENTPPESRVLLLGETRSYALDRPAVSAGNFDGLRMAAFLGGHADAKALAAELRRMGVSHVVVHWPRVKVEGRSSGPIDMLDREYLLPLPRATAVMLQQFVDEVAVRRYQDAAYSVYELPPS